MIATFKTIPLVFFSKSQNQEKTKSATSQAKARYAAYEKIDM